MKKFLSLVLATIMLLAIVPTAFAASAPAVTATADKTSVKVGDTVTVTVKIPAKSNLTAFTYFLKFDTSYFQIDANSVKINGTFPFETTNAKIAGEFRYVGAAGTKLTAAGDLFSVKFKVLKTGGKITCDIREAYVAAANEEDDDIDVTSACVAASTKNISFSTSVNTTGNYIQIRKPSTTTISYKNSIVLHADAKKALPANSKIEWSTSNNNFKAKTATVGETYTITSESNGKTVVTATLVSSTGNTIESVSIELTSKAGFIDKLIGFFRNLFGATTTYDKD